jgi:hypothetical protein
MNIGIGQAAGWNPVPELSRIRNVPAAFVDAS